MSGLSLSSPNGGEVWGVGAHLITWSSLGSPGANIKIELLKGASVYKMLSSSYPNDGDVPWTVTSAYASGTDYRIRITSMSNPTYTDTSNGYFTIP